jgi:hypothetical protein
MQGTETQAPFWDADIQVFCGRAGRRKRAERAYWASRTAITDRLTIDTAVVTATVRDAPSA